MEDVVKHVCPEHQVELQPKQTRKYGTRWECPIRGCSVAWWGRSSATPADAATRKARHEFSHRFLSLPDDQAAVVLQWFAEHGIEGPGFLTVPEARLAMAVVARVTDEARAAQLRDDIANRLNDLSEAGQLRVVRYVAGQNRDINLRTCTDPLVLQQVLSFIIEMVASERRDREAEQERERRRQVAATDWRWSTRAASEPRIEPTKTKRKLDL